jgi:phosphoglycolate phosphatase-like HAD superfamily hydrolase
VGTIRYGEVDPGAADGVLIYVKPAIVEAESYDVYNYARSSLTFPHETTADQWFSESQFESYRALGREAIRTMVGKKEETLTLDQFKQRVESYIRQQPVPIPKVIVTLDPMPP